MPEDMQTELQKLQEDIQNLPEDPSSSEVGVWEHERVPDGRSEKIERIL